MKLVSPVPPPATTAVPNEGCAATPLEINGMPLVDDGAMSEKAEVLLPVRRLYWDAR